MRCSHKQHQHHTLHSMYKALYHSAGHSIRCATGRVLSHSVQLLLNISHLPGDKDAAEGVAVQLVPNERIL